jgi:hypothetical protein
MRYRGALECWIVGHREGLVTEAEARKIFDEKLPLCDVLGLDVRATCIGAGVPPELVDKFLNDEAALRSAMNQVIRDPAVLPTRGPAVGEAGPPGASSRDPGDAGFLCLSPSLTGLPMNVWAMVAADSRRTPYLRVQANHSRVPQIQQAADLAIRVDPQMLSGARLSEQDAAVASGFVLRNRDALLDYWYGRAGSASFMKRIR